MASGEAVAWLPTTHRLEGLYKLGSDRPRRASWPMWALPSKADESARALNPAHNSKRPDLNIRSTLPKYTPVSDAASGTNLIQKPGLRRLVSTSPPYKPIPAPANPVEPVLPPPTPPLSPSNSVSLSS